MPSANGVYSLPIGYLAVTGDVIQASQHNPPLEDIAAALTGRLSRDGTAAMTGAIQLVPGTVSLPGAAFSTDLTTGLYKTTAGIGVAVAGVKVAEFLAGGVVGSRFVGEIFDWTGSSAPPLCVLPYGQTLSRTTYAALWTLAQAEIALGNTFYNNGDGSTTFGIGDCRGRVRAGKDNMGGSAASRLTSSWFGGDATIMGATGSSSEKNALSNINQVPQFTPAGNITNGTIFATNVTFASLTNGGQLAFSTASTGTAGGNLQSALNLTQGTSTFAGTPVGSASPSSFRVVQPTIITNTALYAGA